MNRKLTTGIMLTLLLMGMLMLAFDVELVLTPLEEWVPYVPSSQMVDLELWMSNGTSYINVSITFPDSGYMVSDWGTVVRDGGEIWVDSEIWDWTGYSFMVITTLSHSYNLGELDGYYTFIFQAWGVDVKSISFSATAAQMLLDTDRDIYFLGENVTIILKNVGAETVSIGGYPAWGVYTYPEEEHVFPMYYQWLLWSLEPGENDTITWDQYNPSTQSPADPGLYVVRDGKGWGLSAFFVITLIGDIDGDLHVDYDDFIILAGAYGTSEGDPLYNRDADVNRDGNVDYDDFIWLAGNYGETL